MSNSMRGSHLDMCQPKLLPTWSSGFLLPGQAKHLLQHSRMGNRNLRAPSSRMLSANMARIVAFYFF